jgi:hypothetical protein
MFGKFNRESMLSSHSNIREQYLLRMRQNLSDDTKRHLHRGFLLRLSMMEEATIILDDELSKAQGPLSHHLAIRLTLFLNAYYLNLAGSLDNLAWALTYHHNLINNIDEDKLEHRRFAQLLGKDFLAALRRSRLDQLSAEIEPFRDWYWEMRDFRDPAAHRIPLFVPTSVYSEDDVKESQRLDTEAAELISKGEWDEGMSLLSQSYGLGKHMPIFISETSEIKPYDLAGRVDDDHQNWLKIVEAVLRLGF